MSEINEAGVSRPPKKSQQEVWRKANDKKEKLLGMPIGTAAAKLRKAIMFCMAERLGENICYRCQNKIETVDEFSIEHKDAWQIAEDPVRAFFDLENVSFSHRRCNVAVARKAMKRYASRQERLVAYRPRNAELKRAKYCPKKRRARYLANGR